MFRPAWMSEALCLQADDIGGIPNRVQLGRNRQHVENRDPGPVRTMVSTVIPACASEAA